MRTNKNEELYKIYFFLRFSPLISIPLEVEITKVNSTK
uniref:Uncharacterized protein n=1 Tax=Rhizophora mucronata TaxID=61149 RepID=A0A2P2PVT9_RHIMU